MFDIISVNGGISAVNGVFCDGVSAGLKGGHALDVAFIHMDCPCDISAVFTKNTFQAAPIRHFLQHIKGKKSNFFLINTKNANAMTGDKGLNDVCEVLENLKAKFSQVQNPIMSSTGVIGQYLPKEKIIDCFKKFDLGAKNGTNAADAIRTTDRFSKEVAFRVDLVGENGESSESIKSIKSGEFGENGEYGADSGVDSSLDSSPDSTFHIGAMAKGAGMIAPEMATMLCFIATDANIPEGDMEEILRECLSETFNAISVDGDTSTNDSVFLFTTRKSRAYDKVAFKTALKMAMKKLAIDMVSDGEGATKVVAFEVKNAKNKSEAVSAAKALSNSLLVKTAIFGGDPNWGRIASTIGACGVSSDPKKLKIFIGENLLYDCEKINFEAIKSAEKTMQKDSFRVVCDLGIAESSTESGLESNAEFVAESNSTLSPTSSDFDENDAFSYTAYGCDLGYKYVEINSQYTS